MLIDDGKGIFQIIEARPMKSIPGFILSLISAVIYAYLLIVFIFNGPSLSISNDVLSALVGSLLIIILLPFIIALIIASIVACILTILGTILTGVGKTKAGGTLVIVGAAIGFFFALNVWLIPLIVGIVGGILAIVQGRNK